MQGTIPKTISHKQTGKPKARAAAALDYGCRDSNNIAARAAGWPQGNIPASCLRHGPRKLGERVCAYAFLLLFTIKPLSAKSCRE